MQIRYYARVKCNTAQIDVDLSKNLCYYKKEKYIKELFYG